MCGFLKGGGGDDQDVMSRSSKALPRFCEVESRV